MTDSESASENSIRSSLEKEERKEKDITQSSPKDTAGDTDAAWGEAETAGTELPGGGNETPDESNVEEIGKSIGESYEDTEPLDPTKKEKPAKY